MKRIISLLTAALLCLPAAHAEQGISSEQLGLSKTNVRDAPAPPLYTFSTQFPGTSQRLPRAYPEAPPQIPHNIDMFIPIKMGANQCLGCHNNPALWGQPLVQGIPTPIPKSHYTDLRNAPDKVTSQLIGSRYVCVQCHTPQANAQPLVANTFGK